MGISIRGPIWAGIVLGTALFFLAAAMGIRAYGLQETVPPGFAVGGLPLGRMELSEAHILLQNHAAQFRERKLLISSSLPDADDQTGTFGSVGLHWDISSIEAELNLLREGSPFRRAWIRFRMRGSTADPLLYVDETAYHRFVEETWAELQARKPSPARRVITDRDHVYIIPDVTAYRVNEASLLSQLLQYDWIREWKNGGDLSGKGTRAVPFELPVRKVKAQVTAEMLSEQGIDRKISEFSTSIASGDPGRLHNISSTARTIQDRLLAPGEVFDYASVVKETESRFGFREAPVIFNGKLAPGIGGGICQVSSTLYNAALRAGLEIVERRNHSLPVSYVPLGQDATYAEGYINFKFRNHSGSFLLIRAETGKNLLTIKLFGRVPADLSYEIESVTVEELDVPVKTVINPALQPGQSETLQQGKPGYIVETYRTKKQNGTLLSKERISRDRYLPQPKLVAVGGKASVPSGIPPTHKQNVLEDGVSGPNFR